MHYSSRKCLRFPCKKCIIILVRNKYTTQRYIVKEIKKRDVFGYNTAANEIFDALDETGYYAE